MAIRFHCISCRNSISVHDRLAKREIKCPHCEFRLTVPASQPVEPSPPEVEIELSEEDMEEEEVVEAELIDLGDSGDSLSFSEGSGTDWISDLSKFAETTTLESFLEEEPASESGASRHKAESEEEDLEWDITPMVDVAFLLLIFFMITASFSIQKAIPTAPPQEDRPGSATTVREAERFADVLTLQIDEFNGYTLVTNDGTEFQSSSKQELIAQLEEIHLEQENLSVKVLVQAHNMSTHGAVVSGIDAARKAGYVNFQVQAVDEF